MRVRSKEGAVLIRVLVLKAREGFCPDSMMFRPTESKHVLLLLFCWDFNSLNKLFLEARSGGAQSTLFYLLLQMIYLDMYSRFKC